MKTAGLVFGWILAAVGLFVALPCALLTFICIFMGPYGWIYDLFIFGPLTAAGFLVFAIGRYLRKKAGELPETNYSTLNSPAISPSRPQSQKNISHKEPAMTDERTNRPSEPAGEPARAKQSAAHSQYNPITFEHLAKPCEDEPSGIFGSWNTTQGRMIAAPVLLSIYFFSQEHIEFAPVTVGVLLACLLFRLSKRHSEIMALPLVLATLRLATLIGANFPLWGPNDALAGSKATPAQALTIGLPWLPMFFAICLFYMPMSETFTNKIMVSNSVLLLSSGLLPGGVFATVFLIVFGTLFFTMLIGFALDFKILVTSPQPPALAQPAH